MLYDPYGRLIPEIKREKPASGMQIILQPVTDRDSYDVSRGLTPRDVDRVLVSANGGDVEAQCRLARELPEKNATIAHALRTRRNAAAGCAWSVEPGDESEAAAVAAKSLEKDLDGTGAILPTLGKVGSFSRLLRDLTDAILPGFSAAEILWRPGGMGFYGFRPVEQRFFSFTHSFTPRLRVTGNLSEGERLPRGKIVFHELGENGSDPVRGGLIRPLVWLHCFSNLNLKDLLSFIERYGMPFVKANIDQATWEKERVTLNELICNFGPNGGGVFSKNTEVELLQASNNTGDVYFKLLEYMDDAITKVLLGQTASSGESTGLSGGDAQSKVRQDILEADARALEDTVNRDLFAVWTEYNFPDGTPAPRLRLQTEPPEDQLRTAQILQALAGTGLRVKPEEVSERFGFTFERAPDPAQAGGPVFGTFGQGTQAQPAPAAETQPDPKALQEARGIAIRAGTLTPTAEIEAQVRRELGLPEMPEAVKEAWKATGGIRQPITLKPAESAAVSDALNVDENEPDKKASGNAEMSEAGPQKSDPPGDLSAALSAWLGPLGKKAGEIAELSDEEFDAAIKAHAASETHPGHSAAMETLMEKDMVKAYAQDQIPG